MTFLRKPYIYIIIGILLVVVIILFSGIFGPEQFGLVLIVSPMSSSIQIGQNTTIAAIIENTATSVSPVSTNRGSPLNVSIFSMVAMTMMFFFPTFLITLELIC